MTDQILLTPREMAQVRQNAEKARRRQLDDQRPQVAQYQASEGRDTKIIGGVLLYAKAAVPVIALLAALASAVRTVQVVSTIYLEAGSHAIGVIVAAVAFTLAIEGTLFVLALAQEGEAMRRRAARSQRHVGSLRGLWYGLLVRVGVRPALRWDEMPESSGRVGIVLALALAAALATNLYLGMQPIIQQMGASSLQAFIAGLWHAPAALQMAFAVDLVLALFAPLVAFAAGHLTARYAAEIAERSQAGRLAYERDLAAWREAYASPLETDEGAALLAEHLEYKRRLKAGRQTVPFGNTAHELAGRESGLMSARANGHGGVSTTEN
jgi:hypothetical protein